MTPQPEEIFAAAADLIEPKGAWTRHFTARKPVEKSNPPLDNACLATDPKAIAWGVLGAIFKIGRERGLRNNDCYSLGRLAEQRIGCESLTVWAAQHTQAEVVAGLRKAAQPGAASKRRAA